MSDAARPPRPRQRRRARRRRASPSRRAASRSSTSSAATSRSQTRTAACVVVQNGEIYNYPELRRELERAGTCCRTHCDTEALVHLYEEHGAGFAERLRGMFAVAIWDARRSRLVLARDRYGIKPLYYRHVGGELRFASELRALPRGEIDLDALEAFLAFNSIPAPYSIFRDVRKLPAGHVLVWEDGAVTLERYARPGPATADELRDGDEAELVEELRARLRDSVRAHLLADVPVGVLLSGGVDSAALAALAAQETPERGAHLHDRLRGAQLRRARRRAARRRAVRHGAPRAARAARAGAAAAGARRGVRRAVRRLVGAADLPRLAAGGRAREGRALGRGRRRAVRRLLHVRRPICWPTAWRRSRALARPLVEALPASTRKASLDYKAKRFVRAAHLPPLERHHGWKEIFSAEARGRAHRPPRRLRPGRRPARALRRDRRARRSSRGCRTSTSASTSSTTCS